RRNAVHVSRLFKGESDNLDQIALSMRVRDGDLPDAPLLGVVVATLATDSKIGLLRLGDERRKPVLLCPRDTNPPRGEPAQTQPDKYEILVHPAYQRGERVISFPRERLVPRARTGPELRPPDPHDSFASDDNYQDPVAERYPEEYAGRWLASIAPVGNTE